MSNDCETPRQLATCDTVRHEPTDLDAGCPAFDICLPFGGRLYSDGGCVLYSPPANPPADGTYGRFTVRGGCITSATPEAVETYTTSPCAPVPCDCGSPSDEPVELSTRSGNLLSYDASGALLGVLVTQAGPGITISGNGTTSNPLKISAGGSSQTVVVAGNTGVTVTSSGNRYVVSHGDTGHAQTIAALGLTFDGFGHFTKYTQPSSTDSGVKKVIAGNGIAVAPETGVCVVSLDSDNLDTTLTLGRHSVKFVDGIVTANTAGTATVAGSYETLGHKLTVNEYGTVTNAAAVQPDASTLNGVSYVIAEGESFIAGQELRIVVPTLVRASHLLVTIYTSTALSAMPVIRVGNTACPVTWLAAAGRAVAFSPAAIAVGQSPVVLIKFASAVEGPALVDVALRSSPA